MSTTSRGSRSGRAPPTWTCISPTSCSSSVGGRRRGRLARSGAGLLRGSSPFWVAAGAFLGLDRREHVAPAPLRPRLRLRAALITAAKFGEYAILAPAVRARSRRTRDERELLLGAIAGWASRPTAVGLAAVRRRRRVRTPGPPAGGSRPSSAITTSPRWRAAPSRSGWPRSFSASAASPPLRRPRRRRSCGPRPLGLDRGPTWRRGRACGGCARRAGPKRRLRSLAARRRAAVARLGAVARRAPRQRPRRLPPLHRRARGEPEAGDRGRRDVLAPDAARLSWPPDLGRPSGRRRGLAGLR